MTVAVQQDPEAGVIRRLFRQVMRSMVRKAQNDEGAMVALFLPPDVAAELAQPGGIAPDDLHLTLKVLSDQAGTVPPEQVEAWAAEVERAARDGRALVGRISGVGRFNGDQAGGQDVVYATLDLPGLSELYQRVGWMACYPPEDYIAGLPSTPGGESGQPRHDFTPHVTLAYGTSELPDVSTIEVRIDRITLAIGNDRREFLFSGAGDVGAQGAVAAVAKAAWSAAFINDLPDSAFLVVEAGGEKDADGKTTPRTLRHFPVKDADGTPDPAHVRNALARIPQSKLPDDVKTEATAKATAMLESVKASVVEKHAEAVADAVGLLGWLGEVEVEAELVDDVPVLIAKSITDGQVARFAIDETPSAEATLARLADPVLEVNAARADYRVLKAEGSQRYTLGVAYPAKRTTKKAAGKDTDAHGDSISVDELERSAWNYLRRTLTMKAEGGTGVGLMHADGTDGAAEVVESYIYRGPVWKVADQTVEPGDWLLGVVWSDGAWAKIEAGEITGYSLQGWGFRDA